MTPRARFIQSLSALDARTDGDIRDYFVETSTIRNVQASPDIAFAIVGLKGAGKTTLFRSLSEGWGGNIFQTPVGLSTETATFENYFESINCLQFEKAVRPGMMLFILKVIEDNLHKFSRSAAFESWLKRKAALIQPRSSLSNIIKSINGLSILEVGIDWQRGRQIAFKPLPRKTMDDVEALILAFAETGHQLRIIVDDPDRLFTKGSHFDPHLMAGYILGTNWLAARFPHVKFLHVLKSSVYDMLLDIEEIANLPHDYFHYISWSKDELIEVITSRLKFSNCAAADVFEDENSYGVDILYDKIRNGPRDMLRYLEIILKSDPRAVVGRQSIIEHEATFKEAARRQMESVYSPIYDGIEAFVDEMFSSSDCMTVADFKEKFERMRLASAPASIDYSQAWLRRSDRALRTMIDAGVIDFSTSEGWMRPFEKGYFKFNSRGTAAKIRKNAVFT